MARPAEAGYVGSLSKFLRRCPVAESTLINKGLEGVVVNTTSVSHVDGEAGRLFYSGKPIT
jgi:citrate synthase